MRKKNASYLEYRKSLPSPRSRYARSVTSRSAHTPREDRPSWALSSQPDEYVNCCNVLWWCVCVCVCVMYGNVLMPIKKKKKLLSEVGTESDCYISFAMWCFFAVCVCVWSTVMYLCQLKKKKKKLLSEVGTESDCYKSFSMWCFFAVVIFFLVYCLSGSPRAHLRVVGMLRFMSKIQINWACPLLFILCSRVCFSLMALSTVFHSIISPTTLCFLTLFFRSYRCLVGPFNYMSLYTSLLQPWCNPWWLTGLKTPIN